MPKVSLILSFLLFVSGCVQIQYRCIVPACSGRITDLNGKPLKGVRVRITSYGVVESAYSDTDGRFKLKPLFKYTLQRSKDLWELDHMGTERVPTIAGHPSPFFGELGFYFETPQENFVLVGNNPLPPLYKEYKSSIPYGDYYYSHQGFFYCTPYDWELKKRKIFLPPYEDCAYQQYHLPEVIRTISVNPWVNEFYAVERRFILEKSSLSNYKIQTRTAIVYFDKDFLSWQVNLHCQWE